MIKEQLNSKTCVCLWCSGTISSDGDIMRFINYWSFATVWARKYSLHKTRFSFRNISPPIIMSQIWNTSHPVLWAKDRHKIVLSWNHIGYPKELHIAWNSHLVGWRQFSPELLIGYMLKIFLGSVSQKMCQFSPVWKQVRDWPFWTALATNQSPTTR